MAPIDIASRRELFVDHHLIDRFDAQASLKMHPPTRAEVVFQVQSPLENGASGVYSVLIKGDDHYLYFYRGCYPLQGGGGDHAAQQTANVAISTDGIHFERPVLGLYEVHGSSQNNVVWQGIQGHNFVPFRDTNPDCAPEARYKAVGGTGRDKLYAFHSPDGIHWRLTQDAPLAVHGNFDSANVSFWDPVIGKYRLFSRFSAPPRGRSIQSSTSDDFIHWTAPVPHEYADDAPADQFYTNGTTLVPGAEHILLSFPMRYVPDRETPLTDVSAMDYPGTGKPGMSGVTDAVMMSSRDGVHWNRPFPQAWLRPGLDDRNWTHRNSTPAIGILPLRDDEWSMYVSEHYGWPDNRLRRLTIRPWGFGSIHGDYHGGSATTKAITFSGSRLRLNMATSAVGAIQIELRDADDQPIPGYTLDDMAPIYGDRLDQLAAWTSGSDLSALAGQPIRLHIRLHDADLYAIQFTD